jgi:hypothetical protein
MTLSTDLGSEISAEVSHITTESGLTQTVLSLTTNIPPTAMAIDCLSTMHQARLTFPGTRHIKVKHENRDIRHGSASGSTPKTTPHKHSQHSSDNPDSCAASDFDSSPGALATPPCSKRSSLAAFSSVPASGTSKRRKHSPSITTNSPSPATPTTTTATPTTASPPCMTDGSESDTVLVHENLKSHSNDAARRRKTTNRKRRKKTLFSCHLFAHDPSQHPGCSETKLTTLQSFCEHIQKKHLRRDYCPRCGDTFDSRNEAREHMVARSCPVVSPLVVEGVHPDRIAALAAWQPDEKQCLEAQWREMWEILFRDGNGGKVDCWAG